MSLEENIVKALSQKHLTLSTAESCTGGLLAHTLTNVPGSSKVFKLGLVLYSNQSKSRLVKVPVSLLRVHGAVKGRPSMMFNRPWPQGQRVGSPLARGI